jgi:hypothetical protein
MTRLFWYAMMLVGALAVAAVISWIIAYTTVNDLLGAPPPEMGTQTTTFLWKGMPRRADHAKAWRFAFKPTRIPGASSVVIYVSPLGQLYQTDPSDLASRVKAMHAKGFN